MHSPRSSALTVPRTPMFGLPLFASTVNATYLATVVSRFKRDA